MTRRSINIVQFWLKVGFFSIPAVAYTLAGYIRFKTGYFPHTPIETRSYINLVVLVTLLWALVVEHLGLDQIEILLKVQTGIRMAATATASCLTFALAALFFYRSISFARVFVVTGGILMFVLSFGMIHLFRWIIYVLKESTNGRFPIAILGADDLAVRVADHLAKNPLTPCKVACFVALPNQNHATLGAPVLPWDRLDEMVDVFHCKEVFVALPLHRLSETQQVLENLQHLYIPARMVLDLGQGIFVADRIFDFYGLPLLDVRSYPLDTVGYAVGKRAFDICFSILALILSAPLMLLIALGIKLTSRGPVLFVQERVSLNGRRFEMLKFRTMSTQNWQGSNTKHTQPGDPRITAVGKFLRRTSLDELTQFINVLAGDMSVVGPRPELSFFVEKFRTEIPSYMARHNVKCGMTGWAQVNGLRGSGTSIPQRIQYDLYYLRNWSMTLDLKIIFLTVFRGLISRNAY
ncbi:MAG: undecaprenyl-phosphate glucose phosphotransferase [Terriglobales bacterium]